MNILSVENISKSYGTRQLFDNISFGISQGKKIALIAKNGAGKSTLIKCFAGIEKPDKGIITFRNGITIGYLSQDDILNEDNTILEEVLSSDNNQVISVKKYIEAINENNNGKIENALELMDSNNAWSTEAKIKEILSVLKLDFPEQKIKTLSGGQKKRISLAKVLIQEPDFLLLDEPTNHLDLEMIEWLENYLSAQKSTLFMVTHDRYFLESVCDEILELNDGTLSRYKGNYSYYLEKKAEREEIEQVNIDKAKNLMKKELDWLRRQPKARTTKSKARIDAFDAIKEKASVKINNKQVEINIKMDRLGAKTIEIHKVSKSFDALKILDKFSYNFQPNERLGIIGNNGTGKTTFLNLLNGTELPDGGKIVVGDTVKLGYYTQKGINLKQDKRVIEVITDIAEFIQLEKGKKLTANHLLELFLFNRDKQYAYVSTLSGGEKKRLYLLTVLMQNPNFLILDEPTNDLDIPTMNVLENYLMNYDGCIIVVTHDRYFMDKITDHLFVFKGDGVIDSFIGNYSDYLQKNKLSNNTDNKPIPTHKTEKHVSKKIFGFNEKREYGILETEIPKLEKRRTEYETQLSDTTLSVEKLNELSEKLGKLIQEIEYKTLRWFELSELQKN